MKRSRLATLRRLFVTTAVMATLLATVLVGQAETAEATPQPKQISLQNWATLYGGQFRGLLVDFSSFNSSASIHSDIKLFLDATAVRKGAAPRGDVRPWEAVTADALTLSKKLQSASNKKDLITMHRLSVSMGRSIDSFLQPFIAHHLSVGGITSDAAMLTLIKGSPTTATPQAAPIVTTTTTEPAPTTTTTAPAPPPTTAPAPPPTSAAPAGCTPIDDEGGCYEPGEYCRDDDHGVTGVAGDGETITCEDNDGWRWEPT